MPKNVRANIELGINIIVVLAIVSIAIVVVKRYVFSEPADLRNLDQQKQLLIGSQIDIPNVNWERNGKSLVFFLDKDCAPCTRSAPFYSQLIDEASRRNVKWMAVLPSPVEEARQYLLSVKLPIENVLQDSLSSFKIPGTPSVLLVNNKGTVKNAWLGAKSGKEKEVKDELIALLDKDL